MSNNNADGEVEAEAAMMVVDDQLALAQNNSNDQPTEPDAAANGNEGNEGSEGAEAENEDEEMVVEEQGENQPASNGTTVTGSTSRYSLRKRSRKPLQSILGNTADDDHEDTAGGSSKSNGRGGKQPDAFGYISSAALTDREFEKLLAHHEERGVHERAQKKLRLERGYADDDYPYEPPAEGCPAFDSLPKEAIQLVFELLPSVRAVFNLAYQSKYMLSFVEERTDIVVRAAVLEEAHKYSSSTTRTALSSIMRFIRKRSIHVPSALRLLRLCNAKRCERGSDCWALDLKTGLASKKGLGYSHFGFALCPACEADCSTNLPKAWRWNYSHWSRQNRVDGKLIFHGWRSVFDADKASDLCVGLDGERIGPILSAKYLHQIAITDCHDTEKQKERFNAIVKQEYGEEGSDELEAFEKACTDVVQIHDDAENERKERHKAHWEKQREDNKVKHDAAVTKKRSKIEPTINALEEAVADAPLNSMALDFEWQDNEYLPVKFKYHFVKDSLGKLLTAPSSASQKKIKAACENVRRKLQILATMSQVEGEEDDFFSLKFLSAAHEETSSSLQKRTLQKIKEHCNANLTGGMKGIIGGDHWYGNADRNNTNDRFFDLLEAGPEKYVDAVLHILSGREALSDIVSGVLVSSTSTATDLDKHRQLAKAVWKKMEGEMEEGFTKASFFQTLSACITEFRTLKQNATDYLDDDNVKAFRNSNVWDGSKNRKAVDQVWDPQDSVIRVLSWQNVAIPENVANLKPYRLLLERNFESLLRMHRFYRDHIPRWQHSFIGAVSHLHRSPPSNGN